MTRWRDLLFLGVLWIYSLRPAQSCTAEMTQDFDLLVDSPLVVNCTLNSSIMMVNSRPYHVNSSLIRFKFQQRYFPPEQVTQLDNMTAQLRIERAHDYHSGPYFCFLHIPEVKNVMLCLTNISVGYKPRPASNFSCISYNFKSLVCNWSAPFNPVRTTYTLQDLPLNKFMKLRRACPEYLSPTSCQWRTNSVPPYRKVAKILYFRLEANNSLGSYEDFYTVPHHEVVLPGPPHNITTVAVGRESVSLAWTPPKEMIIETDFPPGLIYQVEYSRGQEWHFIELMAGIKAYNITGLIPFTTYHLRVKCRANVSTLHPLWSSYTGTTILTRPDVPYLAPEISPEVFESHKVTVGRNIKLYWHSLPLDAHNGPDFRYLVRFDGQQHNTTASSIQLKHLALDRSYTFVIQAANTVGESSNISSLTIPPAKDLAERPRSVAAVARGAGRYDLSWRPPASGRVQHFMVVWCATLRPRPFACSNGSLGWQVVGPAARQMELRLPDEHINYQFAVAVWDGLAGSGLSWAGCVMPANNIPPKPSQVWLDVPRYPRSLRLAWQLECRGLSELVQAFLVSWCPAEKKEGPCAGPVHSAAVADPKIFSHNLTNLLPYMVYRVTLSVRSLAGDSEPSDPLWERTMPAPPPQLPPPRLQKLEYREALITWDPPGLLPGNFSHYLVKYGSRSLQASLPRTLLTGLRPYTNYSISVAACIHEAGCSPDSLPLYVFTPIAAPGSMDPPRVELLNASQHLVRVAWQPPEDPNGPLDMYTVEVQWEDVNGTLCQISHNVTGLAVNLTLDCPTASPATFTVFATNRVAPNQSLTGLPSQFTSSDICFPEELVSGGMPLALLAGVIAGSGLCLALLALGLYSSARWMKAKMDRLKAIKVQLPSSLDDARPYENLKRGLFFRNDSLQSNGGPPHSYGRLDSDDVKERHSSGHSQYSSASTEELLHKKPHLESQEVKSRVSSDSGAETDTPPSPESAPSAGQLAPSADSGLDNTGRAELGMAYLSSLANSEPSVADLPPTPPIPALGAGPYCKLGLARSLSSVGPADLLTKSQPYSRFGRLPSQYISFAAVLHGPLDKAPPVVTTPLPSYSKCELPTTSGYVPHAAATEMLTVPSLPEEDSSEDEPSLPLVHPPYIPHSLLPTVGYVPADPIPSDHHV